MLVAVVGVAIMKGQTWGRWVGIGLVGLSLIANFLFIPYYPIWSLVIIALDVAVIAALATPTRERMTEGRDPNGPASNPAQRSDSTPTPVSNPSSREVGPLVSLPNSSPATTNCATASVTSPAGSWT